MSKAPLKLTIELIPSTVWYSSIYHYYKKSNQMGKWHELKQLLFEREGKACWICKSAEGRLEAHEFWKYDDAKRVQKLGAIHHLCGLCHKIKHSGLWLHTPDGERMLRSEGLATDDIVNHFCLVNKCSKEEFQRHENDAFKVWDERNKHKWRQDFGDYDPKYGLKRIKSQQQLKAFMQ